MSWNWTPDELAFFANTAVRVGTMVELQFDEPLRMWNGSHTIAIDGNQWGGTGLLGQVDGLTEVRNGESAVVNLILSGTNAELNSSVMADAENYEGRDCNIGFQLFDPEWQPVFPIIQVFTGITQPVEATRHSAAIGDDQLRTLSMPVENLFYGRSQPPASLYTAADQRKRYPGDAFLDYQYRMLRGISYSEP